MKGSGGADQAEEPLRQTLVLATACQYHDATKPGKKKEPSWFRKESEQGWRKPAQLETDCDSKGCGLSGRREWTGRSRGQSCGKLSHTGSSSLSSQSTVSSPDRGR